MNTTTTRINLRSSLRRSWALRAMACTMLAVFLSALPVLAATVTFQEGVGGYNGTLDTLLQSDPANAGTDNGAAINLGWDDDDPGTTGFDVFSLLQFSGIFGAGPGQIPFGSQITSATLHLNVSDVGDTGEIRDSLLSWGESDTFNSFCAGSCDQGVEHGPLVVGVPAASLGDLAINVTSSLQAWSDGTPNNGWFIRPTDGGNGGADVRSSEFATAASRPELVIVYDEGPPVVVNLIREPYLTLATPTTQTVCWRSDVTSNSRVQYGLAFGSPTSSVTDLAVVADHCVEVIGLAPDTQYWYNVGSMAAVQGGGSVDHYFKTPPVVGSSTPFRFWAVGDGGNGLPAQVGVMNAMLAEAGATPPDFAIYLGDIAYNSGTDAEFTNKYFGQYDPVLRNTVVWPTLGNHEGASTTSGQPGVSTGPYYEAFVLPDNAQAGGVASGTEAYYSFDYGNVHFISLNSTITINRTSTGPMANWLSLDLASTTQQWVVAFWHHPAYSKGSHNSDTEGQLVDMRENFLPILEAGGVDLVMAGHSHAYERSFLIDGTYTTPTPDFATLESNGNIVDDGDGMLTGDGPYLKSPGPNAHEGAVYVTAGHGGQPTSGNLNHPVMFFGEAINGSCLIDVDANTMTLRNVRISGVVSDNFTIQKGDLPPRVAETNPPKESVLGTLSSVTVTFTTGVTGVDAADLTVNGSAATSVTPTGADVYTFDGFAVPGDGLITVDLAAGGIVDASDPGLIFDGDTWFYTIDISPPAIASESPTRGLSLGVLPSISVQFTKPVFNVDAADLLVGGSPATSLSGNDGAAGPYIFSGFPTPPVGLVMVEMLQDGIEDDQTLPFAGDIWTYLIEPRLMINEFLASNNTIIADETGGFDDYLEIYNPGTTTIDMSGMYLSDNLSNPTQYQIPAGVTIGPKEYLLFWCDEDSAAGPFHTNFNLDKDALTNQDIGVFDTAANGFAMIDGFSYTLQVPDVSSGRFPDGAAGIVSMPPTPAATNTIGCSLPSECSGLNSTCTVGDCVGSVCVSTAANEGGSCDDGVSCTSGETCGSGACDGGTSTCAAGEVCNESTDMCEVSGPFPGDVIISGFNPTDPPEWIELFNTTSQPISLADLNLISRVDTDPGDGTLNLDWQLSDLALDLSGETIAPYSFYLVGETATSPAADLDAGADGLDLATGEGGTAERAISLQVTLEAVPAHMDYVIYGRHDGSDTAAVPPGDLPFDGSTFPRVEVTRTILGGLGFNEGVLQRLSEDDLHAGHDVEGYYTDEDTLGDGFPNGVWSSSSHGGSTVTPRNSTAIAVPPPSGVCTQNTDCSDGLFCNGAETCVMVSGICLPGSPPDCADSVACTADSCNETTDGCDNVPVDSACDDSNVCTDDTCDGGIGCQNVNNTDPCEDGDLCTTSDVCAGGICTTGFAVDCNDTIVCTDDSCDPGTGCINADNCPAGEACDVGGSEVCQLESQAPPLPIVQGDDWTYFKGTVEPTTPIGDLAWAQVGFDDLLWLSGPSGFGYGDIAAPNTLLPDMQNGYNSVYFRREFSIANPAQVESLILTLDYDDAFAAYINGVEVVRSAGLLASGDGTPQGVPPTFNQLANFPVNTMPGATQNHESSGGANPNPAEVFDIGLGTTTPTPPVAVTSGTFVVYGGTLSSLLLPGNNVIAIHGHNVTAASTDFVIVPTLDATFGLGCTDDLDCDDGEACTDNGCNLGTGECEFTANDGNSCTDGEACTDDACVSGSCVSAANDSNPCTDGVACTDDSCLAGVCDSADNCIVGEVCNVGTGSCEVPTVLLPGDVIVSGFQATGTDEWIELFNTTSSAIALDNLDLIIRVDANGDGNATLHWQLPVGLLNGVSIAPQSFFLLREGAGPPAGDLIGALDLGTGEGGTRALSIEAVIDSVHMDYVLYGRNDLEPGGTANQPPGDLNFDGVSFPRTEVVRSCAPLAGGLCAASPSSFVEGAVLRVSDGALYAGHDAEGYYTDETALSSGFPDGVWSSDHDTPAATDPRNSGSPAVPPPSGTPCTLNSECDDSDVCNGVETCNLGTGFCQSAPGLVCNDGNACTDDSCDPITGCQTSDNTAFCDDADACTSGDVCGSGVCLGAPIICDDGLSCTDDSCDSVLGCQAADNCPAGESCDVGTNSCEVGPTIVMFQNDGSYTGTQDTFLQEALPTTVNGALEVFEYDAEDPAPLQNFGLIRLDGIVGGGAGQIPAGATISSATLTVQVVDPSVVPEAELRLALVDWDESTANWDNFGGEPGVQPDEVGALIALGPLLNGSADIDVTTAVQGWVADPASNFGLIFVPQAFDGIVMNSSEFLADPSLRPKLTVEYVDAGVVPEMSCALSSASVGPGGSVDLEVFLASPDGDVDVRGFQTQVAIALTSGSGSLTVPCPGGVFVDEARPDYIFFTETNDVSVVTCSLQRASGAMLAGSTTVGAGSVYLSEYTLDVAPGTVNGTTFEISFVTSPGSRLSDENAVELPLTLGPACTLTVSGCGIDTDCDDSNLCTVDSCNAGTCENVAVDCSSIDDQCNAGVCDPGSGLCEAEPANEAMACDDGDACSDNDTCTAGVCTGPPLDCNDGSACTNDSCSAGSCVYTPSGVCSIEGDVFYYRDNTAGGFEPSAKGVPSVDIDVDQNATSDATSDSGGAYLVPAAGTPLFVEPLAKFGATTISDDNGAVTSFDATSIAQHAVGTGTPLTANQLVAGDVSGNGSVSSFDAAQVAQFAVSLLPGNHFQIAFDNGSDWAFFRCDNYISGTSQDCGPAAYLHDPLLGSELDDDFHAVLYGDVTGNWLPMIGPLQSGPEASAESAARAQDMAQRQQLQSFAASPERLALLQQMPKGALLSQAAIVLSPTTTEMVDGRTRQSYLVNLRAGDGVQGLDLEFRSAAGRARVVSVTKAAFAEDFNMLSNDLRGSHKVALYGVLPLQGSGAILEITVEFATDETGGEPFRVSAVANERTIPVTIEGRREISRSRRTGVQR